MFLSELLSLALIFGREVFSITNFESLALAFGLDGQTLGIGHGHSLEGKCLALAIRSLALQFVILIRVQS